MEAIDLQSPFVLARAVELQERLRDLALLGAPTTLDLRWTDAVDVCGLQLLLALAQDLERQGSSLRIWPGEALTDAVALAGLKDRFDPLTEAPTAEVW